MYKIKIFSQESYSTLLSHWTSLEKKFNMWSKNNPEVIVLDLKYQVHNGSQYLCVGYDDCNCTGNGSSDEEYEQL